MTVFFVCACNSSYHIAAELNVLVFLHAYECENKPSQVSAGPLHSPGPATEPTQVLTLSLPDSPKPELQL